MSFLSVIYRVHSCRSCLSSRLEKEEKPLTNYNTWLKRYGCDLAFIGQQHDFALDFTLHHRVKGLCCLIERVGGGDIGLELALYKPGEKCLKILLIAPWIVFCECAPEHTNDRAALKQWKIERNARNITSGEANDQVAALPSHAAQCCFRIITSHRIVDDIDALAAGK